MFAETLAPFFAEFGDDGTLDGAAVRGIFDAPAAGGALDIAATDPSFQIATASVPASPYGKTLVVPQGTFTVREHLPDGTGVSVLLLQRAS